MMMLISFTFSCKLEYEKQEEAVEDPVTLTNIKAYEGLEKEEIEENFYMAEFMEVQTIQNALHIAKELQLDVSHVKFSLTMKDGTVKNTGFILLPDSFDTSEAYIRDIKNGLIHKCISDLEKTKYNTENIELIQNIDQEIDLLKNHKFAVKGFQAVLFQEDRERVDNSGSFTKVQRQFNENSNAYIQKNLNIKTVKSLNFAPNISTVEVSHQESGDFAGSRMFHWSGVWQDQGRLDDLCDGPNPAFEPDIKLRFRHFLGVPTYGWAMTNPANTAPAAITNFDNGYIDSQTSDMGERTYCMGTTAPENMVVNQLYYFYLYVLPWKPSPTDLAYQLDKYSKHLADCEGWTWCVGVGERGIEQEVFAMGDYQVGGRIFFSH